MDKYEYVIAEDLDYKPDAVEQGRFEYSPLGKIFDNGLKEEDKKQGLLERQKNIEDKIEELLKAIKNETENIKKSLILSKNL